MKILTKFILLIIDELLIILFIIYILFYFNVDIWILTFFVVILISLKPQDQLH